MKLNSNPSLFACCLTAAALTTASANERLFTYTYEPETMPQGAWEYEQWVTLRSTRNAAVGEDSFHKLQLRHELEYGVTDRYTASLYLNESYETFRDATGHRHSGWEFDGVSLENMYMVLNPATHAVGLTLYLEPRIAPHEAELEQKIILGQRHGDWKWAFNLTHATEWGDDYRETEGELEASFGAARALGGGWSLGLEVRDHNEIPEYSEWENSALYAGPVLAYHRERWWGALTVMPQVFGVNFSENADRNHHLELEGHERWNVRLIVGVSF